MNAPRRYQFTATEWAGITSHLPTATRPTPPKFTHEVADISAGHMWARISRGHQTWHAVVSPEVARRVPMAASEHATPVLAARWVAEMLRKIALDCSVATGDA